MATIDSISAAKARLEELKGVVEDQRAKKDEYAAIISQQSGGNSIFLKIDRLFIYFLGNSG